MPSSSTLRMRRRFLQCSTCCRHFSAERRPIGIQCMTCGFTQLEILPHVPWQTQHSMVAVVIKLSLRGKAVGTNLLIDFRSGLSWAGS